MEKDDEPVLHFTGFEEPGDSVFVLGIQETIKAYPAALGVQDGQLKLKLTPRKKSGDLWREVEFSHVLFEEFGKAQAGF